MNAEADIRDILPSIRVPTLVMNRTGDPVANIEAARDLASRIEGARFVEFPGATHALTTVEPERVIAEIRAFLTGSAPAIVSDRALATLLFVDIVGLHRDGLDAGGRPVARSPRPPLRGRRAEPGRLPGRRGRSRGRRAARDVRRSDPRHPGGGADPGGCRAPRDPDPRRHPHRRDRAGVDTAFAGSPSTSPRGSPRWPARARSSSRAPSATSSPAPGIELESRGRRTLKGVPDRRLLFAVAGLAG